MSISKNQNKNNSRHFPNDGEVKHIPVMLNEVLSVLNPKVGESYLDLTAGYGGHAAEVLERTLNLSSSVLVDRDENAIKELNNRFMGSGVNIVHTDFVSAAQNLLKEERTFDLILADLGVSSPHLNQASRGFSFMHDAPLDMRMDTRQALTADDIVNSYDVKALADILRTYGEEPKAMQIANRIVNNRPIHSSSELAKVVAQAWPGHSKNHPATRTFQALRIAVNNELGLLEQALPLWVDLLAPDGRLVVLSFHSLEDRIVKQFFAEIAGDRYDSEFRLLTKKPTTPGQDEIVLNPRARSTKLRAVAKIKTKKGDANANYGKK